MIVQSRIGVQPLPKLIFFDTNIVQNLHSFGDLIYEHFLPMEMEGKMLRLGQRISDDIFALEQFMALGQRAGWPIAVSANTMDELEASNRPALISWGGKLAQYLNYNLAEADEGEAGNSYSELRHFTAIQRLQLSAMLNDMPQESDRQLVIDAREYGCDIFLTMDYKTIWQHRKCADSLGIEIMRPVELLEYIRPWAGLLA